MSWRELIVVLLCGAVFAVGTPLVWPIDGSARFDKEDLFARAAQVVRDHGAVPEGPPTDFNVVRSTQWDQLAPEHREEIQRFTLTAQWRSVGTCQTCEVALYPDGTVLTWAIHTKTQKDVDKLENEANPVETEEVEEVEIPVPDEAAALAIATAAAQRATDLEGFKLTQVTRTWSGKEWFWRFALEKPGTPSRSIVVRLASDVVRGVDQNWNLKGAAPQTDDLNNTVVRSLNAALLGIFGLFALVRIGKRLGVEPVLQIATWWTIPVTLAVVTISALPWAMRGSYQDYMPMATKAAVLSAQVFANAFHFEVLLLALLVFAAAATLPDLRAQLEDVVHARVSMADATRMTVQGMGLAIAAGAALVVTSGSLVWLFGGRFVEQPFSLQLSMAQDNDPWIYALCGFFAVACLEEVAHRGFILGWVQKLSGSSWLGVAVGALTYGGYHAGMYFLPPREPWWGVVVTMTAVGAVWGWGRVKFGLMPVIIAHWVGDLFMSLWPKMALGDAHEVVLAWLTILAPLAALPAWIAIRDRIRTPWT